MSRDIGQFVIVGTPGMAPLHVECPRCGNKHEGGAMVFCGCGDATWIRHVGWFTDDSSPMTRRP